MARAVQKKDGIDVLEVVTLQEIVLVYIQSIILNFFVVFKNVLFSLKRSFDSRIGPTRQNIVHKFPALSLISSGKVKVSKQHQQQQSFACSRLLMEPQLGNHKYIKLKTTKLHYVESGSENDETVLLLHGFPDCFFGWRHQIPVLSETYRVIALDLKGFSDSDKPALRHNYRPNVICSELKAFLEALNIKAVRIVGHDLGGLIGWIFALKFPDKVTKLITISAPHPNIFWETSQTALLNKNWCKFVQMPFMPERELNSNPTFIKKFYGHLDDESVTNGNNYAGNELLETYKYIFNSQIDWTGPLNYYRNLVFYRVKPNISVRCPCVIISGNKDPNYKLELIIKCGEICDKSDLRIVEGAGHFPHQSHSDAVNHLLLSNLGGSKKKAEVQDDNLTNQPGLVGRMINKMYGVGQHYGNLSVNGNIFSG